MRVLGFLVVVLATAGAALVPVASSQAAAPTSLTLRAEPAYAGNDADLVVRVVSKGEPVPAAPVELERRLDGVWTGIGTVTTDAQGRATQGVLVRKEPGNNLVRASYAGDATHDPQATTYRLPIRKRNGRVVINAPKSFVDERSARMGVRWTTGEGEPVGDGVVRLERRVERGVWRLVEKLRTDATGRAATRVSPREDSHWRARAVGLPWVERDTSRTHFLDNLPPGVPVDLPAAAPSLRRHMPPQAHARGRGPNPVINRIPDKVWNHMTGVSWHRGCPVGRSGLRLLRINYWDYKGYRRRGELVAAAGVIGQMSGALSAMYREKLPLRSMYRVDHFGWSSRLRGGDDYASMNAGNTSAFNCRDVVGRPGVRSPHSYGRSLDVNTWENPYRSAQGIVPNVWWQYHSHPRVAWRSRSHAVVRIMLNNGLRWTYGLGDTQHFDAVPPGGRLIRVPGCTQHCD